MELRDYQIEFVEAVEKEWQALPSTLGVLPTGCHAPGTKVLLACGGVVDAEEVRPGDALLGMDGTPRNVVSITSGRAPMVEIRPTKGEPFVVTHDHVLTLVRTKSGHKYPSEAGGVIVDVPVSEWMQWPKSRKHIHKLLRVGVQAFCGHRMQLPIDPYIVGMLLGDGSVGYTTYAVTTADIEVEAAWRKFVSFLGGSIRIELGGGKSQTLVAYFPGHANQRTKPLGMLLDAAGLKGQTCANKFIPYWYKVARIEQRLELLAGLMDTDGAASCGGYDFISKSRQLADDVAFVSRSVGLAAYVRHAVKRSQHGTQGTYWRVSISGHTSIIPCRIPRKRNTPRKQKKDVLRTGFTAVPVGDGDYYGFTVDGDHRYLLGDFTVTHNCGKTICFVALMERHRQQVGGRCLVIAPMIELIDQAAAKIRQVTGVEPGIEQSFRRSNEGSCRSPFVVGSKQTLAGKSDRKARIKDISMVVYDEAHTAATARGRDLLMHYVDQGAVLLGVTATPKRHDKRAMGDLFDSVAYHMDIPTAVDLGWLCRPRAKTVVIESLDLSAVTTRGAKGDFKEGELAAALNSDTVVREIAAVTENEIGSDKTIVFCASVKEAIGVAQILQASGIDADFVCSDETLCPLTDRNDKLQRFKRGSLQVLTNVGILTTGIDIPDIAHIVMARPTKSESLYCLDEHTEVLTASGWVGIDDPVSDAAQYDPRTGEISYAAGPAPKIVRDGYEGEEFWGIANPHLDICVTGRHRMLYSKKIGREQVATAWEFIEAHNLRGEFTIPISGMQSEFKPTGLSKHELRLIGLFMTDGSLNKQTQQLVISQSERYPEVMRLIEESLDGCGLKWRKSVVAADTNFGARKYPLHVYRVSKGHPRGEDKDKRGWGYLEPYISKDVPELLRHCTPQEFAWLIEGMQAGDGAKHRPEGWTKRTLDICTSRKQVADAIQHMAVCRGWKCNVATTENHRQDGLVYLRLCPQKDRWSLVTRAADGRPLYGKIGSAGGKRVWCIEVPTGAIVTRRNGKVAIVGNCQMIGRATRPLPGLVDFKGSDPDTRKGRIAGSAKPHFRITDMVDVSRTHKLVRAHDILAGEPIPELISVLDGMADRGQEQDVIEQVRSARQEAARIKAQQELRRMEAMRRMVRTNAHYTTEEIDLFADEIIRNGGVRRIASMRMPFGKHKGLEISNVPSGYLKWMLENVKLYGKLRAAITREMAHRECAAHR